MSVLPISAFLWSKLLSSHSVVLFLSTQPPTHKVIFWSKVIQFHWCLYVVITPCEHPRVERFPRFLYQVRCFPPGLTFMCMHSHDLFSILNFYNCLNEPNNVNPPCKSSLLHHFVSLFCFVLCSLFFSPFLYWAPGRMAYG